MRICFFFEKDELKNIPLSEGKIVWKKEGFDETVCQPLNVNEEDKNIEWYIGEILTTIYNGLGRYHRGKKLSAFFLIQNKCVENLISLIHQTSSSSKEHSVDSFNMSRRFEKNHPEIENIPQFMLGYDKTLQYVHNIINYVNKNYNINSFMYEKNLELIHLKEECKDE